MKNYSVIEIAQKLVRSGRHSGDEGHTAEVTIELMKELGFEQIVTTACGSVLGYFGPKEAPLELLFDSHIDVATIAGEWSFDPYCADILDGKLLGRGTTDMKGGLAASLKAVAMYASSHTLNKRIGVSATVMEETIEGLGLEEILVEYKPNNVVICEPSELAVMHGQKGRIEIQLTLIGKAAHASNPEVGINSMLLASRALLALDKMQAPVDSVLGAGILVPTDIITQPYPSISSVPERTVIRFDRRSLPGETEEEIFATISNTLKGAGLDNFHLEVVKNTFTTYTDVPYTRAVSLPPWSISKEENIFKAMYEASEKVLGQEPVVSSWKCCTNGSESAGKYNIKTIGLGPGSIKQAHIVDEFISIDEVEKATDIYYNFIDILLNKE